MAAFAKEGGGTDIPKELSTDGSIKFSKESGGKIVVADMIWSNASLSVKQPALDDPERFTGSLTIGAETKDVGCLVSKNY